MKYLRRILRSPAYLLLMVLFLISALVIYAGSRVERYQAQYELFVTRCTRTIDSFYISSQKLLSGLESQAVQISMLPSVNALLYQPGQGSTDQYLALSRDLEVNAANRIIESVVVVYGDSQTVFHSTDGLYRRDEFFDQDLLTRLEQMTATQNDWIPDRSIQRPFFTDYPRQVLSYICFTPIFQQSKHGAVCLNIRRSAFENALTTLMADMPASLCIRRDAQLLYQYDPMDLLSRETTDVIVKAGTRYLRFGSAYATGGLALEAAFDMSGVDAAARPKPTEWLLAILLAAVLAAVLALLVCLLLFRPIEAILKKLSGFYRQDQRSSHEALLTDAVNNLLTDHRQAQQLARQSLPSSRDNLLLSAILGNGDAADYLMRESRYYGLTFDSPLYTAMLVELCDMSDTRQPEQWAALLAQARQYILQRLSTLCPLHDLLYTENTLLFWLGLPESLEGDSALRERFAALCGECVEQIEQALGIKSSFCFGASVNSLSEASLSFYAAKQTLLYSSVFDSEHVSFADSEPRTAIFRYKQLEPLVTAILNHNDKAIQQQAAFFSYWVQRLGAAAQQRCFLLVFASMMYQAFCNAGFDLPEERVIYLMQKTARATSADDEQVIGAIIEEYRAILSSPKADQKQKKVEQAVEFIREHYAEPISTAEIGAAAGHNHIYLNRMFKQYTGKTLSEYLNWYRIQVAMRKIEQTDESAQDICKAVGYSDLRTFQHHFLKFTGCLPTDYKASLAAK